MGFGPQLQLSAVWPEEHRKAQSGWQTSFVVITVGFGSHWFFVEMTSFCGYCESRMAVFNKALFLRQAVGQTQKPCPRKVGREWRWDLPGRLTASVRSSRSSWELNVMHHCTWHGQSCDLMQFMGSSEHEKSSLSLANHSSYINPVWCMGLYTLYKTTALACLPIIHSGTVLQECGLSQWRYNLDFHQKSLICHLLKSCDVRGTLWRTKMALSWGKLWLQSRLRGKKSRAEQFCSKSWGTVFRLIIFQRHKNPGA